MTKPVINLADVVLRAWGHGSGQPPGIDAQAPFEAKIGAVAAPIGAKKLGANLIAVPPGKRAFPRHNHRANEELFYVISGEGVVRIGDESYPIRAGDVIVCPAGGPETAHHLLNTSASEELRYLAISTMQRPEISEYPDSGKFANFWEPVPGAPERADRFVGRRSRADYWDGE